MWVKFTALSSILSHLLLSISLVEAFIRCYDTGNFTINSTYGKNRDLILASLPPNVSAKGGFFTANVGQNAYKVYALGMCRGDSSRDDCYKCVNSTIHDLKANCPNQKEALSWEGQPCHVHYADRSFYGTLEELGNPEAGYNTGDIKSNLTEFDTIWESLMDTVVRNASNGSSTLKYATGEADFTVFQKIYALMQCTPDLSHEDCDSCLRQSVSNYESCCHGKQGGYVTRPSCYFRWDLYPFYSITTPSPSPDIKGINLTYQSFRCYNDSGSFTTSSTYGKNLDHILDSLPHNVSENGGFYEAIGGQDSNKAYALGMCRGDLSKGDCYRCVSSSVNDLRVKCFHWKEAVSLAVLRPCIVHYANRTFFGNLEVEPTDAAHNNESIKSDVLTKFEMAWDGLVVSLRRNASNGSSKFKYATEEAKFTESQTIYALMQCTPDLSQENCWTCLKRATETHNDCCRAKQGGFVQKPNCYFLWDLHPFYALGPDNTFTKDETKQNKPIWIPLGGSLSATLGLALFSACGFFIWRRRNGQEDKGQEVRLLDLVMGSVPRGNSSENFDLQNIGRSQEFPSIQLNILQAATNNFCDENKLGQGGFGPVYKGTLADGKEIAVKRLSRTSGQGLLEFKNEVMLIAKLQHRNLVRLLGCCLEKNEKLLVYEFMPNKSLDMFLFDSSLPAQLVWQKRFNIIKGTARGIMYLHEDSRLRIIHRDLKASNVLLDHEMNPKISDFGMAKIFGRDQNEANTNRVVGTYGYMAPEYAMEGLFSVKSDVFSFGVLLLEIISGKRNNGFHLSECGESLLTFNCRRGNYGPKEKEWSYWISILLSRVCPMRSLNASKLGYCACNQIRQTDQLCQQWLQC
ncbi:cysteine-rich receptor-like protein kinase 18 isoform X2 [Gossypium hirsutum]|uniref:Cysteine-rich receptor-like protein kinase 18 isoform X2 n=1 Tax=Gossypium hirsutum TaxID=3635 RepID=A0A1U8KLE2_GOSHI|nr:cysteine-rich receptor-like protein kinase 18 isoform X2 [Gossypium hirsutum]